MLPRLRHHLPLVRRALRRRRRLLAALAVAVLAAALLPSVLPPSTRGVEVLVADVEIPAGTVLEDEHLRTVRVSPQLRPAGTLQEAAALRGRTALTDIAPGTPLLPGLLSAEHEVAIPDGTVLMAVPVPESLVDHLHAGTGIELLPADPTLPASRAVRAQVVETVPATGGTGGLGAATSTAEVVAAVPRSQSGDVAHALATGTVMISVIGS